MTPPATLEQAAARASLGLPVMLSELEMYGRAMMLRTPGMGDVLIVGTALPGETEAAALVTVREGLADVLEWIGEPVRSQALDAAVWHYGLRRRSALIDQKALMRSQPEWLAWFRRHGIDPTRIPVPSWVYVDDDRGVIRHEGWVRDALDRIVIHDNDAARTTIDHHTAEHIAPFPA